MTSPNPERLRATFEEAADLYDRARPGYPPELFDDLASITGLAPGSRVLEIGCGTGQATQALLGRGYDVQAIEVGPNLAAIARRKLAGFASFHVVVGAFETWELPSEAFDAVISATAFHWIDPAVRIGKAADGLRPGGTLAIISTHHIDGGSEQFFREVQACYRRWFPESVGARLPTSLEISQDSVEIDRSGNFGPVTIRRYEWERAYSAGEYVDLLNTYSGHRALDDGARQQLLACITQLMDDRYGGRIVKRYLNELRVAQRRDDAPRRAQA